MDAPRFSYKMYVQIKWFIVNVIEFSFVNIDFLQPVVSIK